jgi:hypothetical protein
VSSFGLPGCHSSIPTLIRIWKGTACKDKKLKEKVLDFQLFGIGRSIMSRCISSVFYILINSNLGLETMQWSVLLRSHGLTFGSADSRGRTGIITAEELTGPVTPWRSPELPCVRTSVGRDLLVLVQRERTWWEWCGQTASCKASFSPFTYLVLL